MDKILQDFLFKQMPVIVVLGLFCFFMYKYFTKVIDDQQELIREKDEEIKSLNKSVLDITTKNNEVIGKLRDLIEKLMAK